MKKNDKITLDRKRGYVYGHSIFDGYTYGTPFTS